MWVSRIYSLFISIALGFSFLALRVVYAAPIVPAATQIVIKKTESQDIKNEDYYFKHVLELALLKSAPRFGQVEIEELPRHLSEKRLQSELRAKK
jgi:hypothetical protein